MAEGYAFSNLFNYATLSQHYPLQKNEIQEMPIGAPSYVATTGGNKIQIRIPRIDNTFYLPATACLHFKATYAGDASMSCLLGGTALSHFSNMRLISDTDNATIDEINCNLGQLQNLISNMTMNTAERHGQQGWGYEVSRGATNFSRLIATTDTVHTYAVPLMSIFGLSNNAIPAYQTSMTLELTLDAIANYTFPFGGSTRPTSVTLDDIRFCVESVRFEGDAMSILNATYPTLPIKTKGVMCSSFPIPAGTQGRFSQIYTHSVSSATELFMTVQVGDAVDGMFGSVGFARSYQVVIGGKRFPSTPVNAYSPSMLSYQIAKAWSAVASPDASHSIPRRAFRFFQDNGEMRAYINDDAITFTADNFNDYTDGVQGMTLTNKCIYALDLETINSETGSLYSGVSSKSSTNQIEFDIAIPLPVPVVVHLFTVYDKIIRFDTLNRVVDVVH